MPSVAFSPQRLRGFRGGRGLTREKLAELADVSVSSILAWERGVSIPSPRLLRALCDALDTSVEEFAPVHDDPQKEYITAVLSRLPHMSDEDLHAVAVALRAARRDGAA